MRLCSALIPSAKTLLRAVAYCAASGVPVGLGLLSVAGWGATTISYVQCNYSAPQAAENSVAVQFSSAQTAGDLNVVVVGWSDTTATVSSVKDASGNTYVRAVGPTSISGAVSQSIYYAKNIVGANAGANTVTVTFSTAAQYPDVRVMEYGGADSSNPVDVTSAGSGSNTKSNSGNATTTNATDLLFGANTIATTTSRGRATHAANSVSPGSGFTSRLITSPNGDLAEDEMVGATRSYNASASLSASSKWVMQLVAFRTPAPPVNTAPTITRVSPASGPASGGTAVTITGTNFASGAAVTFGGIAATNVAVSSSTTMTATTPAGNVGAATVVVTVNGQSASLTGGFTYIGTPTVTGLSPGSGTTAGGTPVTITGSNFASGATVTFGTAAATNVTVVSSTSITATTPAGSAGPVAVTVTNQGAQSGTLSNGFTYVKVATITYVQSNYATPQTAQSSVQVTFTAAQSAGDLNVVVVGWNDSKATVTAVTDSSKNTYARAVGPTVQTGYATQAIYYAKNIAAASAGSNAITVTFSLAAVSPDIRILEYAGADPNNPVDAVAASSGSGTLSSSGTVSTTNGTDLLFAGNIVQTKTTGAGSGFTKRLLTSPDGDIAEDEMVSAAGSYSATAPLTSGDWIMQMVAFRTPSPVTTPPTAPTNLAATAVSSTQISLNWGASTTNGVLANYIVQRCQGSGCTNFAQVATPAATSYNDVGLTSNTSYSYRVEAVDTSGNLSGFSNVATATTQIPQPPTAPANLAAAASSASKIALSWAASTSNVGLAGYIVQRCQGTGCANFSTVATPAGTTYTDSGLTASTSYSYQVAAVDTAGNTSTFSNVATATTLTAQQPSAPSNLSAFSANNSQVNLTWTASTSTVGLANYIVQRCQGQGCTNFVQVATPSGITYSDTGLSANTTYSYQVQAIDTSGNTSPFSNVASTTTGYVLPLKSSANNRYLVDQNGVPFLIMGDSPQSIIGNLTPSQITSYMADRQRLGFNSIWVNLLCNTYTYCNANGTADDGTAPFTSGSNPSNYNLSTPNPAYFAEVDNLVNQAATYNLVVFLDPIETGGWLVTLQNNGATAAYNYGVYIGTRYKGFANIVWLHGNDFQTWTNTTNNNLVEQVMAGIASVDGSHLQSIELNFNASYSSQDTALGSLLTLDSAYTYYETYDMIAQSYKSSPTLPSYLVESNYEYENNTGALPTPTGPWVLREQVYWTMLSGGGGQIYGNHYTVTFTQGWQSYLDSPGALEIQYVENFFNSLAWWDLIPDTSHQVVTGGYGTYNASNSNLSVATYCTTGWIPGSIALTYCPTATSLTVNLQEFSGQVTAQWFDPSNGTYTAIPGSPFSNTGTQEFSTPGNNHDGNPDWVLVLHI